jgi:hypothetical protein
MPPLDPATLLVKELLFTFSFALNMFMNTAPSELEVLPENRQELTFIVLEPPKLAIAPAPLPAFPVNVLLLILLSPVAPIAPPKLIKDTV